jgi:hypothetical protein
MVLVRDGDFSAGFFLLTKSFFGGGVFGKGAVCAECRNEKAGRPREIRGDDGRRVRTTRMMSWLETSLSSGENLNSLP